MSDGESQGATVGIESGKAPGPLSLTQSRPVAIFMVTLAISIFGAISLSKLPVNLMPEFSYPTLTVRTEYPGSAPEDVEDRISRKIEQALAVTKGLRELHSVSRAGVSDVTLEFDWDTEMKFAAQDVRELLDQVVLPEDAEAPILLRYDPDQDPVLRVAVSGFDDLIELRLLAEEEIQRELETVPGVAAVRVRGGLEPEIWIEVDEGALTSRSLDIGFLGARLAQENLNLASGELVEGETEYIVRTLTEFRDIDEIRSLVLEMRGNAPLRLGDVARVRRTHKEREVVTRVDGRECVLLDIYKEAEANIVSVADAVRGRLLGTPAQQAFAATVDARTAPETEPKEDDRELSKRERKKERKRRAAERRKLAFLARELPEVIQLDVIADQSRFIEASIREVRNAAILGGLLAVVVLFLFLRRVRPTLIIATSIPVSIVTTFAPMYLYDVSINIMSLGGLALGIGMLVDNSIVVLESITRCHEEGDELGDAALRGVREVAGAVTASTLTTVSVFFPMVFVEGIAGQIFRDQALTVVFSLLVSLLVSLFLIPMLAARRFRPGAESAARIRDLFQLRSVSYIGSQSRSFARHPLRWPLWLVQVVTTYPLFLVFELLARIVVAIVLAIVVAVVGAVRVLALVLRPVGAVVLGAFGVGFEAMRRVYAPLLAGALRHPAEIAVLLVAVASLSAYLLPKLGAELIPEVHQGEFTAEIRFPAGTPLLDNAELVKDLEERTRRVDGVADVFAVMGVEEDVVSTEDEGPHTARLVVRLEPTTRPARLEQRVRDELQGALRTPELESIEFRGPSLFSFKTPIEIEILNDDLDVLRRDADRVERALSKLPELRDVRSSLRRGSPEIQIRFDREKLARLGLNLGDVQDILRTKILGDVPTRFSESDRKVDIVVKVDESGIAGLADLESIVINPGEDTPRPLRDVASFDVREGPSEIRHIGLARGAVVGCNLVGLDLASATSRIYDELAALEDEGEGSTYEIGGQKREMDVSIRSLQNALILAIFLVYLVMAALFESLLQPFIILLAIPLALLGVIPTLYLLDIPLSVVVFIGMIMLAGIVVNNAIVLIDAINRLRRDGMDRIEAIQTASSIRFRPILMTTLTTVLGLLPLTGLHAALPFLGAWMGSGEGTEIRAPMAITVIAGLLASTFLTLLVVPVGYSILSRPSRKTEAAMEAPA